MSDRSRFVRTERGRLKQVGDQMAVYVREETAIHVLNPTAYMLYEALDEPASLDDLAAGFAHVTGRPAGEMATDLREALDGFLELGLVVAVDSGR